MPTPEQTPADTVLTRAWVRFNDMPSWKAVVLAAVLYEGSATAWDQLRQLWDVVGLNNSVIERIGLAETNIIREMRVDKETP